MKAVKLQNLKEWMLLSNRHMSREALTESSSSSEINEHWQEACSSYSQEEIGNMPSWIDTRKQSNAFETIGNSFLEVDVGTLNEKQSNAYKIVFDHYVGEIKEQLLLVITGMAGSGKSYLINAFRNLLQHKCKISAFFGVAAFNVKGCTLHRLLQLPIRNKRSCQLNGKALQKLQNDLDGVQYLLID